MPKVCMAVAASVLIAGLPLAPAQAWFHGYSGGGFSRGGSFGGWNHSSSVGAGGFSHSSDWGGWDHSTQVTSSGVAHESDYGGAWHGTAATPDGAYHASDYGGYYHGTAVGPYGAEHTGYYGHTTTTAYGTYYHQPATVNYYGAVATIVATAAGVPRLPEPPWARRPVWRSAPQLAPLPRPPHMRHRPRMSRRCQRVASTRRPIRSINAAAPGIGPRMVPTASTTSTSRHHNFVPRGEGDARSPVLCCRRRA